MDHEAQGILGGLFQLIGSLLWYLAIWIPLGVYHQTLFKQVFQTHDMVRRYVYAVAIAVVPPVWLTSYFSGWLERPWAAIGCCIAYAALLYGLSDILKAEREAQERKAQRDQEQARLRQEALDLDQVRLNMASLPTADEFVARFNEAFSSRCRREGLPEVGPANSLYSSIVRELYESDILPLSNEVPTALTPALARYSDIPQLLDAFQEPLLSSFMEFRRLLPPSPSPFTVPAYERIDISTVGTVLRAFWTIDGYVHRTVYATMTSNALSVGKQQLQPKKPEDERCVWPDEFEGSAGEAALTYFRGTPLLKLFTSGIPLAISDEARFEHQWVIATPGSGKTQLLQTQIAGDLKRVEAGEASIVVIDSQPLANGFLSNIARLKLFAPDQPLDGKLVFLRPEMSEPGAHDIVTPALNVFDVGQHDPTLSARDRQILQTSALNMITFTLSERSGQQDAMIRFLVQLAVTIPGVTIDTVRRMLILPRQEFLKTYEEALGKVPDVVRDYFTHTFHTQALNVTREAVARRFMELLSDQTFARMFQNERNAINLKTEIDQGKVVLIHTDKALLGPDGSELFGRFFISLILQATLQRASNKPVFVYIDECADYISNDENVATLIDQARKQRVGFVFAHQRLRQIRSENVLSALSTCAIKFASRNEDDSKTMARYLRTEEAFVRDMPKLSFACHVRDTTANAVRVKITHGRMERMERMTDEEYAHVRQRMRDLYCERSSTGGPPAPPTPPTGPTRGRNVTDVTWEDVV
jgi:hypothetical protein